MNTFQRFIMLVVLTALLVSVGFSQAVGDYGSVANGNWGATATWMKWDGSGWNTTVSVAPTAADNVWIVGGFTVTVEASPKTCNNLYVVSGKLSTGLALPTSSIRYVRISNNGVVTVTGGMLGDSTGVGDALSVEAMGAMTITGSGGVVSLARIRTSGTATSFSITIDRDIEMNYNGGSGTGGMALYTANASNPCVVTLNAGNILTLNGGAYIGTGSSTSSDGQSSTTFNINGTVNMANDGRMSLNVTAGKTSTLNVDGTLNIGSQFVIVSSSLVVPTITVNATGTINVGTGGSGTVTFATPAHLVTGAGTFNLLTGATMTISALDGITASGATGQIQTTTRSFSTGANYIYAGTAAQPTGDGLPSSVNNLTVSNTSGVTITSATVVNGSFQTNGGIANGSNLTFNGTATLNSGGYFDSSPTYGSASTLIYNTGGTFGRYSEWNATSGAGYPANVRITGTTTLNYPNGGTAAQSISGSLTIDLGSALYMDYGSPGMSNPLTVAGNLTLAGSLSLGDAIGGDLKLGGNWINNGGTFNANNRAVTLNGSVVQDLGGTTATTFPYLTINNSFGITLSQSETVGTTLTLTSGNISTGANTLSISSGGTVSRTSGYVIGTLQKNVPTGVGVNETYEIGSSTNYLPVSLTFANVNTAGDLSVSTTDGDHSSLGGSGIDPAKDVNRFWTMNNSGILFDTYDATLLFATADVDVGANANNFIAKRYSGGSWNDLTVGTKTDTSTAITGANSFSDFAIGEVAVIPEPGFSLSSSSLGFGSLEINTTKSDSVYVKNGGTATLNVTSVASDNSPVFTALPVSAVIPVGDSAWFTVTYAPTVTGAASANIVFIHDATSSPDTLTASGSGVFTGAYESNGTGGGDWANTATWAGGIVPGTTDDVIIKGTDSVYVAASTSCDTLTIESGGTLAILSAQTFTASLGSVNGKLYNAGTFTPSVLLTFGNGGIYEHAQNGGTIPTATWGTGSTCLITGGVSSGPGNNEQNFYNFTWNCPGQTGNINLLWGVNSPRTINGNLTVTSTGATPSQFRLTNSSIANNITINGSVIVDPPDGKAYLTPSGSSSNGTKTITVNGDITVTGGTFALSGNSTGAFTWNLFGNFSASNATLTRSGSSPAILVFAKAGTQTYSTSTVTFSNNFPMQVASGSTLDMGTSLFGGSGAFTVDAGAGLITAHTSGIDGNLTTTGTKTLNTGANYAYNGSSAQVTGSLLPLSVNNLTINNTNGVTLTASMTVSNVLHLLSGVLSGGANTLTIGSSGSVSRTSGYVYGSLKKTIPSGVSLATFEIGDASTYAPIDISGTYSGTFDITASTIAGDHSQLPSSTIDGAKSVNRYYTLTGTPTDPSDITFYYDAADVDVGADPNSFLIQKYDGSWSNVNVGTRTLTSTQALGVASFSDFAIGERAHLTIVSNGTNGEWSQSTTWVGGIVPTGVDSVVIVGSDSVYINSPVTCSGLLVQSNGKLALFAQLIPTNVALSGTLIVSADTLKPTGTMTVENGGVYNHARDAGKIPTATWNTGSTLLMTGLTSGSPGGGLQNYYNITWNCAAQGSNLNLGWNPIAGRETTVTVNGDINVLSTGAGTSRWQLSGPPAGTITAHSIARITLNGNVNVVAGQFSTNGTSSGYTDILVTHNGNVNVTGGNFSISRGSQGSTGTAVWTLTNGDFAMSNATTQNSNAAGAKFVFAKPGTQTLTLGAGNTLTAFPIEVASGTTLNAGVSQIRGSGAFILNAGATLESGIEGGIDSTLAGTGTKTLNTAANYTFNAALPQVTGVLLPTTVNNLTINNATGVTLSGNVKVDGALTFVAGKLKTSTFVATIGTSGSVAGAGAEMYVNGNLNKTLAAGTDLKTFEIGDGIAYAPVIVSGASYTDAFGLTAATTTGDHPDLAASGLNPSKSVNRFYTLTGTPTGLSDITFNFVAGDIDGGANTANFLIGKYDNPSWTFASVGAKTATSTQALGITSLSDFAIAELGNFVISATSDANGSIDPTGDVSVPYDGDQTFTFIPHTGYYVDSVYVDGVYVDTAKTSYLFSHVVAPHTISVKYAIYTYTLNVSVVGNGSVVKILDQPLYDHGTVVQLTATPAIGWVFSGWSVDASGSVTPLDVTMDVNKNITATFTEDSVYLVRYRALNPDLLSQDRDNKGKIGKSVKNKAAGIDFAFFVVAPTTGLNDLHLEFGTAVDTTFDFYTVPPSTMTEVAKSRLKKWNLTFVPDLNVGDTVWVYAHGLTATLQKVSSYWWTTNGTMVGSKLKNPTFTKNVKTLPMPNRINILEAAYPSGFPTGMVVGVAQTNKDSIKKYGWVYLKKAADALKTLSYTSRGVVNLHDGPASGFDSVVSGKKKKSFVGKYTSLQPTKQDNILFANLVALKVSIAASALGITPVGFGDLILNDTAANPWNGLTLLQLSAEADTMMTGYPGRTFETAPTYAQLATTVRNILDAFEGAMDTTSFGTGLKVIGAQRLIDCKILRANPSATPYRIVPTAVMSEQPDQYALYQNYPNPFNPATMIQFDLPVASTVTLKIFNILGQEVATLLNNQQVEDGQQMVEFDASSFASGVYFYRISAQSVDEDGISNSFTSVKKMMLIK